MKNKTFETYKESILDYKERHFYGQYEWQHELYNTTVLRWLHNYQCIVDDRKGLLELYRIAFD